MDIAATDLVARVVTDEFCECYLTTRTTFATMPFGIVLKFYVSSAQTPSVTFTRLTDASEACWRYTLCFS